MTKLEDFFYEYVDIDTPEDMHKLLDLIEPLVDFDKYLDMEDLAMSSITDSGLDGFKKGFKEGFEWAMYLENMNRGG